jgi:hypothetical protein
VDANGLGYSAFIGGTCTVVARQPGDAVYAPAEPVTRSWEIQRRPQTIVFRELGPRHVTETFNVSAFASAGLRPVVLTSDTPAVCTVSDIAGSQLEDFVTLHIGGTCTILARHTGDAVYLPAEDVRQSFQVLRQPQTIGFINPGPQRFGSPPVLLRVNAGLPVTLSSLTPQVCTVSDRTATLLAVGTCTILAQQSGNDRWEPAANVTFSFEVTGAIPDPPSGVQVAVNGAHVTLQWTPASTGPAADYFLVEVGDAPGRTTVLTWMTTRTRDVGLLPRGDHYLRVRGVNSAGMSAPSADVWARIAAAAPDAPAPPVGFTARVTGNTVSLSWRPGPTGARPDDYLLEVGSQRLIRDIATMPLPSTTTSLTFGGVPAGVYAARVRAHNVAGYTPPAQEIVVRVGEPGACTQAPAKPVLLTPVVADQTIALAWLEAPGTSPSFVLEAGSTPGQSDLLVTDLGAVTGIGATIGDGQYAVRVTPQSPCGVGQESEEAVLTLGGATPAAPTNLTAVPGPGGVMFTWTPPASGPAPTHYVLEAGVLPGTTVVNVPVGATPTIVVPNVPPGQFVARVRSVNASGAGAASAEITFTVP